MKYPFVVIVVTIFAILNLMAWLQSQRTGG